MIRRATLALLTGLCLIGCGRDADKGAQQNLAEGDLTAEEKARVVARIGDAIITLEDFEARLSAQAPFTRIRYDTPQRKREFLDGLVRFELLALEAERQGFADDPGVELARKQAMVQTFIEQRLETLVRPEQITDAELRAYYDAHIDEFDRPAQVRIAHLRVADETEARKLLAELQAHVKEDPRKARDTFADYVRRHSDDVETRADGGDLGFVGEPGVSKTRTQGAVPPAVATAGFALAGVGQIADAPIQTSAGWHLVQKTGFRRPHRRTFEDVKSRLRNTVYRQRKSEAMEKYVADLRAKATITVDDDALAAAEQAPQGATRGIAPPIAPPEARERPLPTPTTPRRDPR